MVSELSVESQAGSGGRFSILLDFVGGGGKCNNGSLCMDEIVPQLVGNRVLILPKVARASWMNSCCLCTRKQSVWVRIWRCNGIGHFHLENCPILSLVLCYHSAPGVHRNHPRTLMFRHVNSDYSCE